MDHKPNYNIQNYKTLRRNIRVTLLSLNQAMFLDRYQKHTQTKINWTSLKLKPVVIQESEKKRK